MGKKSKKNVKNAGRGGKQREAGPVRSVPSTNTSGSSSPTDTPATASSGPIFEVDSIVAAADEEEALDWSFYFASEDASLVCHHLAGMPTLTWIRRCGRRLALARRLAMALDHECGEDGSSAERSGEVLLLECLSATVRDPALRFFDSSCIFCRNGNIAGVANRHLPDCSILSQGRDPRSWTDVEFDASLVKAYSAQVTFSLVRGMGRSSPEDIEKLGRNVDMFMDRCLAFNPDDPFLNVVRGNLHMARGQFDRAVERLDCATSLDENTCFGSYYTLGNIFANMKADASDSRLWLTYCRRANSYFRRYLDLSPDCHWHVHRGAVVLGCFLAETRSLDPAMIRSCERRRPGYAEEVAALYGRCVKAVELRQKWQGPEGSDFRRDYKVLSSMVSAMYKDGLISELPSHSRYMCAWSECLKCDLDGEKLMPCSRCEQVMYCGEDHQRLDWYRGGHKQECKRLRAERKASKKANYRLSKSVRLDPVRADPLLETSKPSSIPSDNAPARKNISWIPRIHKCMTDLPSSSLGESRSHRGVVHVLYHIADVAELPYDCVSSDSVQYYLYPEDTKARPLADMLRSGDVVLINPGTYDWVLMGMPGSLVHPMEIIGVNGPHGACVLQSAGEGSDWFVRVCTKAKSEEALPVLALRNLKLVHLDGAEGCVMLCPSELKQDFHGYGNMIESPLGLATTVLENVELVSSDSLASMIVCSRQTRLIMKGCHIHDCAGAGVELQSTSSATISNCRIEFCGKGDGPVTSKETIVASGQYPAILASKRSKLLVEDTTISHNLGFALQFEEERSSDSDALDSLDPEMAGMLAIFSGTTVGDLKAKMKQAREEDNQPGEHNVLRVKCMNNAGSLVASDMRKVWENSSEFVPWHSKDSAIGQFIEEQDRS